MGGRGSSSKMSGSGTIRAFPKVKDLARRLTKAEKELVEKEVEDWKSDVGYRFGAILKKKLDKMRLTQSENLPLTGLARSILQMQS